MSNDNGDSRGLHRRHLMTLASAALANALLAAQASAQARRAAPGTTPRGPPKSGAPGQPYLNKRQRALLDEIAEAIIPADDVSGGAKAAGVGETIERQLAESLDLDLRNGFRDDLDEVDRIATSMLGRGFVAASPADRARVLERISRNESSPKTPAEFSFGTLKWLVTYAYYKSRVGIHDDLKYQGNVLIDEFIGVDVGRT